MQIKDIANVITGYTFRGAVKPENNGNVFVFQAKDLVRGKLVTDINSLTRIIHEVKEYSGYLKKNDVLLVARGMKSGAFRSTVFISNAQNVIPSSSVHIIRVTVPNVLPEYISQYLNSSKGQDDLSEIVSGSYIGAILRKDLENVDIPIPSVQKQKTIVNLFNNIQEQQSISNQENKIKQNIINSIYRKVKLYDYS